MDYKCKEGMVDNRMIKDSHQQGIDRVKQRKGDMEKGHNGKMGITHGKESNFKRPDSAATPRKA